MKKIEIIIRPEKFESLKQVLNEIGVKGMTVSTVVGCGNQKGRQELYRGNEFTINLLYKTKVEIVARDKEIMDIIKRVREAVSTGNVGDGKIFVYNIENAIRIRTGEEGNDAI